MKSSTSDEKRTLSGLLSVVFWLLVWWIASLLVGEKLFLPSPLETMESLISLIPSPSFWRSILFSSSRVVSAYLLSFLLASILGSLGGFNPSFDSLLSPLVKAMRSVPVASIVILVLLWVQSRNLSAVVSTLVVFPILYTSFSSGIRETDPLILEAADNYGIRGWRRIRYVYIPSIFPNIENGIKNSLGLCWKSAAAAEVIGLPSHSIGSALYEAKIYLDTPSLFAWTFVIVVLAFIFEKVMLMVLEALKKGIER